MTGEVFRDGVEEDLGGVVANADFPRVLQTRWRIRRTFEAYSASGTLREDGEGIRAVIERCGGSGPVLLVIIAFRQRPDLVAAIVDPAACRLSRRNVLALVSRIHEQVRMSVESDLHQPAAQLRNERQTDPVVRDLLAMPSIEFHGPNGARGWLTRSAL